jgi:hypothetical protein
VDVQLAPQRDGHIDALDGGEDESDRVVQQPVRRPLATAWNAAMAGSTAPTRPRARVELIAACQL